MVRWQGLFSWREKPQRLKCILKTCSSPASSTAPYPSSRMNPSLSTSISLSNQLLAPPKLFTTGHRTCCSQSKTSLFSSCSALRKFPTNSSNSPRLCIPCNTRTSALLITAICPLKTWIPQLLDRRALFLALLLLSSVPSLCFWTTNRRQADCHFSTFLASNSPLQSDSLKPFSRGSLSTYLFFPAFHSYWTYHFDWKKSGSWLHSQLWHLSRFLKAIFLAYFYHHMLSRNFPCSV